MASCYSLVQRNQVWLVPPIHPFGFATVSSYGLGSYLVLFGLYLSALSVSHDNEGAKKHDKKLDFVCVEVFA